MRTFIGLDFSTILKNDIVDLQSALRQYAIKGRWKYIDNFHLTLKFLDEIDTSMLQEIDDVLHDIASKTQAFQLNISKLGFFPGQDSLRVLWLGIGGELERLLKFQKEIDKGTERIGFPVERRPYKPHVTIGQDIVFNVDIAKIQSIAANFQFSEIDVSKVAVFKSEQIGKHRVYTPIQEFRLLK